MSASGDFFKWGERYRNCLVMPLADDDEGGMRIELQVTKLWSDLRPILDSLAQDAEAAGIDSTPCWDVYGLLSIAAALDASEIEPKLDAVWAIAKRLSLDPWVEVLARDITLVDKSTRSRHAREGEHIRSVRRGVYEIRRSRLGDYCG